ncbi:MAG: DUF4203 domain-containing protein [Pirellulales bacterium]
MSIVNLLLGIVLLLYGRTLYWLFVALAGALVGSELAAVLLADQPESMRLLAAVLGAVLGAIVGIFAQRIAFVIGGLFAGGYLGLVLARAAGMPGDPLVWSIIGGILGAIVAALVMDWAIIALSSLAGAAAIVGQFNLEATVAAILFVALAVIGVAFQGRRLQPSTPPP